MGNFPKLAEGTQLRVGSHQATVLQYLSEGGFAHIYKVRIDPMEEKSDIACLKRVIVSDKAGLNHLRKEVDVMKILRHGRNIVKYYDSHAERLENGTYQVFVLMELCPNKSLLDYMNANIKTKLPEDNILKIMFDISLGIYEMHRKKLIHRDIKIENVLINSKYDFKLCDFGSTSSPIMPPKDQNEYQALSHDILYQTTPQYRSPEMIDLYRGLPIDEKSDIWALGCFLYKLCYYTTPFETNGDIAILHASYQLLPSPIYSGDLKNLIIIMLQENPYFRPNIVQVIMLLSKIMNIDFNEADFEDFYKVGPYNFSALHEYQKHKQNELLHQQRLYYQHQASVSGSKNPSSTNLSSSAPSQTMQQPLTQHLHEQFSSKPSSEVQAISYANSSHSKIEPDNNLSNSPISGTNVIGIEDSESEEYEDDVSFGDLEKLENVEERYPSLDNLLEHPIEIRQVNKDSRSGLSNSEEKYGHYNESNFADEDKVFKQYPQNSEKNSASFPQLHQVDKNESVESSLHKSHEPPGTRYQPNHWQYYQQKQGTQYPEVKSHKEAYQVTGPVELEKKEAWEKLKSKMDESTDILADEIFSADIKSNKAKHLNDRDMRVTEKVISSDEKANSENRHSTKQELNADLKIQGIDKTLSRVQSSIREPKTEQAIDDHYHEEFLLPSDSIPNEIYSNDDEAISNKQFVPVSHEIPAIRAEIVNERSDIFPINSNQSPRHNFKEELKSDSDLKKRANPWEEYRPSSSSTNNATTSSYKSVERKIPIIEDKFNLLKLDSSEDTNRKPFSHESIEYVEPNLIDLEIGLESSSSNSVTPVLKPKSNKDLNLLTEQNVSLVDLSDDDESTKYGEHKPHFKKRISSLQNPATLVFQEEVIDFASDDENPENSSKMNRLSIRNSLKKPKSRKSSEHRRADSSNSDTKKRLSMFGGNNNNN